MVPAGYRRSSDLCADGETEAGRGKATFSKITKGDFFPPERYFCDYVLNNVRHKKSLCNKLPQSKDDTMMDNTPDSCGVRRRCSFFR